MFALITRFIPVGYLIMGACMAVIILMGYLYYVDSQGKISSLMQENGIQKVAIAEQKVTITSLEDRIKVEQELRSKFDKSVTEITSQNRKMLAIFEKHNFDRISERKPGMVEDRANNSTRKMFRDMEDLTK